jgi:hypothetical protein
MRIDEIIWKGTRFYLFQLGIWMRLKGDIMNNRHKPKDPLPETFASEEEAGEFWDEHSTADYEEYLEPVDMTIDFKTRHYLIEIDPDSFLALVQYARKVNQPIKMLANTILKENLKKVNIEG